MLSDIHKPKKSFKNFTLKEKYLLYHCNNVIDNTVKDQIICNNSAQFKCAHCKITLVLCGVTSKDWPWSGCQCRRKGESCHVAD